MNISFVLSLLLLGWACDGATALAQSPGAFTATGGMITPRGGHTATLLLDGRVLIAGGVAASHRYAPLASAEIYDPVTNTFSPTGEMTILRGYFAAALLPNGRVLAIGYDGRQLLAGEVYDPLTDTFSEAGAIDLEETQHTYCGATLLSTGKLLLTTSIWWPPWGATPCLYDPTSAAFAATAQYATDSVRLDEGIAPVAVLLADGKVLTTWESWKAEVYNPDTATYLPTNDLIQTGSTGYSATLLPNGNVLIAGGDSDPINQLYDPASGKFTATGHMKATRSGHSATLLSNGTVLITGGASYALAPTVAELYHPDSGTFTATGSMMTPRMGHTTTLLRDGTVLIAGGMSGFGPQATPLDSAEIYHPAQTRPAPVLLSATDGGAAILHASTQQIVSQTMPAGAGEALEIYMTGLSDSSVIPPLVFIGGRMAEVLFFGEAPGFPGLSQTNVRVPVDIAPGPTVPVRVVYLNRPSNEVTIPIR